MDVQEPSKFRVASSSRVLIVLLLVLLAISLTWNVRQYQLIERERQRTLATERERAERAAAEAARTQAWRKKKAEEAAADQRVRQLYNEIDNLGRMSDRLLALPVEKSNMPRTPDVPDGIDGPQ